MIGSILYFLTLIGTAYISLLFYKSKNGLLRKHLIAFFSSLSWALLTRGLQMMGYPIPVMVIIIPFFAGTTALAIYLHFRDKQL